MNQFINQPVVGWARQALPQTLEIKLKGNSLFAKILLGICFAFLAFIFLTIPLLIYYSAFSSYRSKGWNSEVTGGLVGGTFFLAAFGVLALVIFFLMRFTRRKFAKVLSHDGVETRGGQRFNWKDLHYLDYKKVSTRVNPNQIAATATRALILSGVEKVTVEMVFATGKAVVPPLIREQPKILNLLNSMPVQRRDDGTLRQ